MTDYDELWQTIRPSLKAIDDLMQEETRDWTATLIYGPRLGPHLKDLGPIHGPTRMTLYSNRYQLFNSGRPGRYRRAS